jgi:hypothetical protein
MRPYGIRKRDDDCCPGHAKYGQRGLTAKGVKRPRSSIKINQEKLKCGIFQ